MQETINYIDFTLCMNKAKHELKKCYEKQFKNDSKFVDLVAMLFQNEI